MSIKLDFIVVDNMDLDTLYGLIKITSLSSTTPSLFNSLFCSSSLYSSYISWMLSSTYLFPHLLYASNSSANILWTWYAQSFILLWIKYRKSSDIPRMSIVFIVWLLMLAFRMVLSISVIVVFASSAIFIIFLTCFCTFIIASKPFNILWYSLLQSLCSSSNSLASSMLFSFLVMYRLGKVGAVA